MRKHEEIANPESCWNRATPEEFLFVLLERDAASSQTIRFWCRERIRLGKNRPDDKQIQDALAAADEMDKGFFKRG